MTPERWARIKELFELAMDNGDAPVTQLLREQAPDDPDLVREVELLVEEHRRLNGTQLVDKPARNSAVPCDGFPAGLRKRLQVLSRIGSGAFGDVYKVYDEVRGETVALKVLREIAPAALLYFKREFRSLANIHHPNLVELYEFFADDSRWMFTMEFLPGRDLLDFIRGNPQSSFAERESRVRCALPQLANALSFLHDNGLLHRDLKPSNVIVSEHGRLTVLDFGLVRPFEDALPGMMTFAGTPHYMSPEQASGNLLTEGSDWYAVGVMLYQAITGSLPISGSFVDVLQRKKLEQPIAPRDCDPRVAADLNDLCIGLLHHDPGERLRHAAAARTLDGSPVRVAPPARNPVFLGRETELAKLHEACLRARSGRGTTVHISGPSGVGKTLLLREFVRRLRTGEDPLIFTGRCYESESVPYQGLDDLVDSITHYLRRLPGHELKKMLPRNFPLVMRMFPVLGQLHCDSVIRGAPPPDSSEFRSRAFAGLREMLGRIAERHNLVLMIDDLQWSDLDACGFLRELMTGDDVPPLLIVLSYRSEDIEAVPFLGALRQDVPNSIFIDVGPFSETETAQLAHLIAGPGATLAPGIIPMMVGQSGGDPFLIHEIVHWALSRRFDSLPSPDEFRIERVLKSRCDGLSEQQQRLLEVVAIAGQPLPTPTLAVVLGADLPEARNQLVLDRLLRSRIVQGREQLEVYHDRIRAAILSALDAHQLHERHLQLAMALEESGCTDPEPLAMHYHSAGDRRKAGDYARRAAARAIETLAFNKAVEFYRLALQQDVWEARERVALGRSLADILSSAGRGTEAITAYMDAAACAEGGERLRLLSLAAAQLIRTGEIRRGTGLLSDVLDQAGLRSSKGNARRLFSIAQLRLRLRLRGFEFVTRTVDEIAPLDLLRLDLCGTATLAFAMTDPIRSAEFAARYLLLALEAGEPSRLALAFAGQATHVRLSSGRNGDAQAQAFLSRATELAEQANDARAKAVVRLMRGLVAYLGGDWKVAITECDTAAEMFRSTCTSIAWELSTAILFSLISLGNHGNWAEVRRRLPEIIRIAQGRGDLQLALHRILAPNFPSHLAVGDAEKAIELLNGAPGCWPNEQYNIQSCVSLLGRIEIYLYLGNPQEGWRHVEQEWPFLKRSRLLFLPTTFAIVRTARARLAVAMAAQASASSRERKRFLGLARRDARAVLRSGPAWSKGLAHAVLSGIASFAGDREQVKKQLRLADRALEAADQIGFRMGVRYRLARLEREPIASTLREDVQRWIAEQEIREPEQFCGMLVPGCWEQAVQYAVGSAD